MVEDCSWEDGAEVDVAVVEDDAAVVEVDTAVAEVDVGVVEAAATFDAENAMPEKA